VSPGVALVDSAGCVDPGVREAPTAAGADAELGWWLACNGSLATGARGLSISHPAVPAATAIAPAKVAAVATRFARLVDCV